MVNRELTQLISTAKHYLDKADSAPLRPEDLARTVAADAATWPEDKQPHPLSALATFSADLASCATRLATIHEILVGGTKNAWAIAYPGSATVTDENVRTATVQALEILLRDNVAHAETPGAKGAKNSQFRKTALRGLTFEKMRTLLKRRYETLAGELLRRSDA